MRSIKRQIDGALGTWRLITGAPEDLPNSRGLVLETVRRSRPLPNRHCKWLPSGTPPSAPERIARSGPYERVWQSSDSNGPDLRWRIEHAQHIHPGDIKRFAGLGVIAAIQGVHCTSDGPWISTRLGPKRTARTSYRWRDLLDVG